MRSPGSSIRLPWFALGSWLRRFVDSASEAAPAVPRIGLVLSCGGARGLAHVGVIQVLEEEGIRIEALIGSSMGAYVGALWAAGVDGRALEHLAAEIKDRRTLLRLLDPAIPPMKGILRGDKIRRHLDRTLGGVTLGELKRRMFVVATNLDSVAGEILSPDTPVAAAVHASCAIPGICAPVHLSGRRYVDGGASQPLPVGLLKRQLQLDRIIAVNVIPTPADIFSRQLKSFPAPPALPDTAAGRVWVALMKRVNLFAYGNVLDTFKRCLTAAQLRIIAEESAAADVLIHPFYSEARWYDFENFNRYIEAGREAAKAALPLMRAIAQSSTSKSTGHETRPIVTAMGRSAA